MPTDRLGRLPTVVLALVVPLVALVTLVVTLNVTSDDSGSASTANGGKTTGHSITIKNFQFSPDPLVVDAGTTITVANDDGTAHTVTAKNGAFNTGDVDGGTTATITLPERGTYQYFCNIHNYMTGTIEAR